jgi:cytochrome P450
VRGVVEETLRYESPVQYLSRTVTDDMKIGDETVPKGATLVFVVGAAQRDEERYHDPDRFDIRRPHNRHIAFGGDAHTCIGSTLARLEGQIAIDGIFRRFPQLKLADREPDWAPVSLLRGLKTLRVSVDEGMARE